MLDHLSNGRLESSSPIHRSGTGPPLPIARCSPPAEG
jgi:hypothetical protein